MKKKNFKNKKYYPRKKEEHLWHKGPKEKNPKYKTTLCTDWLNGNCKYGFTCVFAHGKEELQNTDNNKCKIINKCNNELKKENTPNKINTDNQMAIYNALVKSSVLRSSSRYSFAK